jgi:hypothetical protein
MLEEERIERERKEFLKSYRYDAKKVIKVYSIAN